MSGGPGTRGEASSPSPDARAAELDALRARLEAAERSLAEAQAANQAQRRFILGLSHEVRTPMSAVLGAAELLGTQGLGEPQRAELAGALLDAARSLRRRLDDLLDLARIESGRLALRPTPVAPEALLAALAALHRTAARGKGLELAASWSGPRDTCYWLDGARLRGMLEQLLVNALAATEAGSVSLAGTERARRDDRAVLELSVTDTGVGLSAERQAQLLGGSASPWEVPEAAVSSGLRLGLASVRRFAAHLGAELGVESRPGQGARFWIRLEAPITTRGEATPSSEATAARATAPRSAGADQPLELLLVDDHPVGRKLTELVLARRGYRVRTAVNGLEAVELVLGGYRPDVVLMDCQMPVLDGYAATRRIRAFEREGARPPLAVIAVTSGASEEERDRCLEAGMDDFLAKPADADELDRLAAHWALRRRAARP